MKTVSPQSGTNLFSASFWFSLFLPLHHTCPTFPSGWVTHCSHKTTCIPLLHIDSHTASPLMSSFLHAPSPRLSLTTFGSLYSSRLLWQIFSDTLPQNSPLTHLFSKTTSNLYHPSGHVVPLTGFLLMYPVLDLLIFWSCGLMVFMKFGKNYLTNILKYIFPPLYSFSPPGNPTTWMLNCLLLFNKLSIICLFSSLFPPSFQFSLNNLFKFKFANLFFYRLLRWSPIC